MNKRIRKLLRRFLKTAYPQGKIEYVSIRLVFQCLIAQRFFRINSHVPWPVHWTSSVVAWDKIIIGDEMPGISLGSYYDGRNGIIIEENVWIGPKVSIISQNHSNNNYTNYLSDQPIRIGKNSLITTGCIILPGVELGEHTIVAAGAVVTKSFSEGNQLIGGNPARLIKKLDDYISGANYSSLVK